MLLAGKSWSLEENLQGIVNFIVLVQDQEKFLSYLEIVLNILMFNIHKNCPLINRPRVVVPENFHIKMRILVFKKNFYEISFFQVWGSVKKANGINI